jgi:general stress protein 26
MINARFGQWWPDESRETAMDEPMKQKILSLLESHRIMTIAPLRPDGWPQATTVGYVNDGLKLWFLCGLDSQKAKNLALDNRVSITIDHDTADIMAITGLSMAARATQRQRQAELISEWRPWDQSTGPRTPNGKAHCSRNADKGGHLAKLRALRREISQMLRRHREVLGG